MTALPPSRTFFAGVDGGGSSTRVLIVSQDGEIGGLGLAEGSNPQQRGAVLACESLQTAFAAAWKQVGLAPQPLASVFFGLAGLSAFGAHSSVETLLHPLFADPPGRIEWDHDLRIALAGSLSGRPGIVVIAGTGSSCYGRTADGKSLQVGGWGPLLDDVGSGYWLGRKLLQHVCRAYDGREPPSEMSTRFASQTKLKGPSEILSWLKTLADPRPEIARLAAIALEASDRNDATAQSLVERGTAQLAQLVRTVRAQLFPQQIPEVAFTGGLSQHFGYRQAFIRQLERDVKVRWTIPEQSATAGAVLLALSAAGVEPSANLRRHLAAIV